jgi:hypothetical protein
MFECLWMHHLPFGATLSVLRICLKMLRVPFGALLMAIAGAAARMHSSAPAAAARFDAAKECGPGVSGVIVVPAVRKGLNNQRMRMVQDAVVASLLAPRLRPRAAPDHPHAAGLRV